MSVWALLMFMSITFYPKSQKPSPHKLLKLIYPIYNTSKSETRAGDMITRKGMDNGDGI